MLPGEELDKTIAVVRELSDASQYDIENELALYFGGNRAREIIAELTQDGVLQWLDTTQGSYLANVVECAWCHWFPIDQTWSHEFNRVTFSDQRPHYYDYRIPHNA